MAKYLNVFNLGLIINEKCNLNCGHCMRGTKTNNVMSEEIINATLDQIDSIGCLSICGGEPLLDIDIIEYIFHKIYEKRIIIDEVNITTNGTIYSDRIIRMLEYMNNYINLFGNDLDVYTHLVISKDKYHDAELKRLHLEKVYLENIKKYMESYVFEGLLPLTEKPFSEGNAETLNKRKTVPLRPMNTYLTFTSDGRNYDEDGICNIGPLITVNTLGNYTECDASIEHQNSIYNYGNVLNESIIDNALKRGIVVKNPNIMNEYVERERVKFLTYNK